MKLSYLLPIVLATTIMFASCSKEDDITQEPEKEQPTPEPQPEEKPEPGIDEGPLPLVMINTPGYVGITSKDEYVEGASLGIAKANGTIIYRGRMKIKGRGNSTWVLPKKPYRIRLDEQAKLFDEPDNRDWVMLANYNDKTMLRTEVATYMAVKYGKFDFVPRFHFTEVNINGKYNGTYQFGDKIEIAKHRVDVGDDGFILEIDMRANWNDATFKVAHLNQPVVVKAPKVEKDDANYNYIKDYITSADRLLYSSSWLNSATGYKTRFDIESFAEWYLVNEITKNSDCAFFASCFMHLKRDGKIVMGPIWDFDISCGRYPYDYETQVYVNNPEGFWIKNATWFSRMFEDPEFKRLVKTKFDVYYANWQDIINHIDETALRLEPSIIKNNSKWGTLCSTSSSDAVTLQEYYREVTYLKTFLTTRMEWLKKNL